MNDYISVDDMVRDLGGEEFYREWKKPSWHKFKNWCWLWYIVIKYRIYCLFHDEMAIASGFNRLGTEPMTKQSIATTKEIFLKYKK